jgi:hypothetical protein
MSMVHAPELEALEAFVFVTLGHVEAVSAFEHGTGVVPCGWACVEAVDAVFFGIALDLAGER